MRWDCLLPPSHPRRNVKKNIIINPANQLKILVPYKNSFTFPIYIYDNNKNISSTVHINSARYFENLYYTKIFLVSF